MPTKTKNIFFITLLMTIALTGCVSENQQYFEQHAEYFEKIEAVCEDQYAVFGGTNFTSITCYENVGTVEGIPIGNYVRVFESSSHSKNQVNRSSVELYYAQNKSYQPVRWKH